MTSSPTRRPTTTRRRKELIIDITFAPDFVFEAFASEADGLRRAWGEALDRLRAKLTV